MSAADVPFNVWLIAPQAQQLKSLRRVAVLDTFDSSGSLFHPEGLFSVETFGRQGTPERDQTLSYISLNTTIIHPEIFNLLKRLKALYPGIISGKRYAVWNDTIKDFEPSDDENGQTGFSFFVSKCTEIQFAKNDSDIRNLRIEAVEKYRDKWLLSNHLVMPAGYRDAYVDPTGRVSEDEVNDLYRKLIAVSNTIAGIDGNANSENLNTARWSMQLTANAIFELVVKMQISGKRGRFQQQYVSRKTRNGTSNVIVAMSTATRVLGSPDAISITDTEMGLLQAVRSEISKVIGLLKRGIVADTFNPQSNEAWLVDKKTFKRELVKVTTETMDSFTSKEGLNKFINRFFIKDLRNKAIDVEGYYLGLLYLDDKYFRIFKDIEELPQDFNPKNVSPLLLSDLIHLSTYQEFKELSGTLTRYPITGDGSIYPTMFRVLTTSKSSTRTPLDVTWQPDDSAICYNFHERTPEATWMDSLSPHICRLEGLGADFDGDKNSSPTVQTEEAKAEIRNYFKKKSAFVGADGRLTVDIGSGRATTVPLVVRNLTGDAK